MGLWGDEKHRVPLAQKKAQSLPSLETTLLPSLQEDVLELDGVWSFVGKKTNPCWLWTALCKRTRQIVAFVFGTREETEAFRLREAIPPSYQTASSYSDLYAPYETAFDFDRHRCVRKQEGQTNHMERWNNTLRQRLGRFVRKTLSFSKSMVMHAAAVRCFLHDYNLSIS